MAMLQFAFAQNPMSHNDLSAIPREGTVYLKSESEQQGGVVWVKRDWDSGFDIRISNYGAGQFSILRSRSSLYLIEELAAMGHSQTDEDDFNNAFIDAASWILHNTPRKAAKPKVMPEAKLDPKPKRTRKPKQANT